MLEVAEAATESAQSIPDMFYVFTAGILAIVTEGFRRYLYAKIEQRLDREKREWEEDDDAADESP